MQHLDKAYGFLSSRHEYISRKVPLRLACLPTPPAHCQGGARTRSLLHLRRSQQ